MDLNYLYFLQNAREATPDVINQIWFFLSDLAAGSIPTILMAIIFWSVSKNAGARMILSFGFANAVNGLLKVTACVYRPWIRDPRLHVAEIARESATGYSFPSGHSTAAGSIYTAAALEGRKVKKWIAPLCIVMIIVTIIGRNWFGAHTPQDVLVGVALGIVMVFIVNAIINKVENTKNGDIVMLSIVAVVVVVGVLYTELKPYPMDYAADGTLLVDPYLMAVDTIKGLGMMLGGVAGYVIERRCVRFSMEVDTKTKVLRSVLGLVVMLACYEGIGTVMVSLFGDHAGGFIKRFLATFAVFGLAPLVFKLFKLDKK